MPTSRGTWRVRPVRRSDLPALVQLWSDYIEEVRQTTKRYTAPDAAAKAFWRKEIRGAFGGRKARGFVAVESGCIVGMLFVELIDHDPQIRPRRAGYVHSAYVVPSHRRRGILRALHREAQRWCARRGVRSQSAWVLRDNREALAIWKRFGYVTSAEYLIRD